MRRIAILWFAAIGLTACQPPVATQSEASSSAAPVSATPAPSALSTDEQGLGTPEAFLTAIYKHYAVDATQSNFSTLTNPSDYYDPDLSKLIDENDRLYEGYIGAIDADPICQCQDWAPITTTIRIVRQDDTSASAVATLKMGIKGGTPYTVKYKLVRIEGHWRIHDLGGGDYPSLRVVYQKSNEDARKAPAEASSSA